MLLSSTLLALVSVLDKNIVARVDVESLALTSVPERVAAGVVDEQCVLSQCRAENHDIVWSIIAHENSGVVVTSETSAAVSAGLAIIVGWPLGHIVEVGGHGTVVGPSETVVANVGDAVGASLESVGLVGVVSVLGDVLVHEPRVELGNLCFDLVVLAGEGYVGATWDDWTDHGGILEGEVDRLALGVAGFDHLRDGASGDDGDEAEGEEAECEHFEVVSLVEVLTVVEDNSSEVSL